MTRRRAFRRAFPAVLVTLTTLTSVLGVAGCRSQQVAHAERPADRVVEGIGTSSFDERVQALVLPPQEWRERVASQDDRHVHLLWVSPTGDTAYGIIYVRLPVYGVATRFMHDQVLSQFLREMRREEGKADLLERQWSGDDRQLAFEAEGSQYVMRGVLTVRGWVAWTAYTGTRVGREENPAELEVARRSRDETRVGRQVVGM